MLLYEKSQAAVTELRSKQIFFIGGAAKSGTTWLQLLLNAHPEVSCNGEGHFLDNLKPALNMALEQHSGLIAEKNASLFNEIEGYPRPNGDYLSVILAFCIGLFLAEQSKPKPARAVGEKTPDNSRYFQELRDLFPTAKFIHVIRDGRDCAVSGWFHNLRVLPGATLEQFGTVGTYARAFAQIWATELATAQRFIDQNPGRTRQVRYEDIASDPERVLAGLFAFLGVEASKAVLTDVQGEASFEKLSGGRTRGDENRDSFFRKGVSGDWRNHLGEMDDAAFRRIAGGWMQRFGYS
jgi:hypothetical protein